MFEVERSVVQVKSTFSWMLSVNTIGFMAVGAGAALGAWLRWLLATWINPVFPSLPMGTLTANLLGGYLIGIAIAFFGQHAGLAPEWRLFVVTGALGGLTTFSTFSAEVIGLFVRTQYALAFVAIATHLIGSLAMTGLGIASYHWLKS